MVVADNKIHPKHYIGLYKPEMTYYRRMSGAVTRLKNWGTRRTRRRIARELRRRWDRLWAGAVPRPIPRIFFAFGPQIQWVWVHSGWYLYTVQSFVIGAYTQKPVVSFKNLHVLPLKSPFFVYMYAYNNNNEQFLRILDRQDRSHHIVLTIVTKLHDCCDYRLRPIVLTLAPQKNWGYRARIQQNLQK